MKRLFLVESDSAYVTIFAYELTGPDYTGDGIRYSRADKSEPIVAECDHEKFFGKLNTLLVTADTIRQAKPISLPEPEGVTQP